MLTFIRNTFAAALLVVAATLVATSAPAQAIPDEYHLMVTIYYSDSSRTTQVGTRWYGHCPDQDWDRLVGYSTPYSTSGIHPCP
ncbi:hypothetical protein ACN27J_25810 [Solwaraspora sp. WMMB762]|uniref:hypothetical protein n=1 Tax=Solwaraspora sp. WMMB762 TaxID=3404120 RepID=UPI003B95A874